MWNLNYHAFLHFKCWNVTKSDFHTPTCYTPFNIFCINSDKCTFYIFCVAEHALEAVIITITPVVWGGHCSHITDEETGWESLRILTRLLRPLNMEAGMLTNAAASRTQPFQVKVTANDFVCLCWFQMVFFSCLEYFWGTELIPSEFLESMVATEERKWGQEMGEVQTQEYDYLAIYRIHWVFQL